MGDYLIVFLLGAVAMRLFQFILAITPNYYIFKHAEYTVFRALAELHINKMTVMKIIELCYDETDRADKYKDVETAVNNRYNDIINKYIQKLKTLLPYETKYSSLNEGIQILLEEREKNGN